MRVKTICLATALILIASICACSNEPSQKTTSQNSTTESKKSVMAGNIPQQEQNGEHADPKPAANCTTIMDNHCTSCHHVTRICQKLGKKNKKGWQRTTERMVRHGSDITPAEADTLNECLDQQSPEIKEYCR